MGKAGDERGQCDHELQERAALHGEREHPMRGLVNARGVCLKGGECILVNRAHTHAGLVHGRGLRTQFCGQG